jgi:hypothetical protein
MDGAGWGLGCVCGNGVGLVWTGGSYWGWARLLGYIFGYVGEKSRDMCD